MYQNPNTKTFGEDDLVTDPDEMWTLGLDNPVVHTCLTLYQKGELTFEQAMMSAVKFLATQNQHMFSELVKQINERVQIVRVTNDRTGESIEFKASKDEK